MQAAGPGEWELFEAVPDAVGVVGADGRVIFINRQLENMFGYPRTELLGESIDVLLPERFRSGHVGHRGGYVAHPRLRDIGTGLDLFGRRKDGGEFPVDIRLNPHHRGDELVVICAIRDLTRRKRLEAALRETESHFRVLVESVKDYAIFLLDPSGNVTSWTAAAERMQGYRAEEIVGQHFSAFYFPEDVADGKPKRLLERALADGRCEDEGWRVRKDGSRFWADVVSTAVRDPGGDLRGYAEVVRDVTERKRAQEGLWVLAEASRLVAGMLDASDRIRAPLSATTPAVPATNDSWAALQDVARLVVPTLGDGCLIDLIEGGEVHYSAVAHVDATREDRLRWLRQDQAGHLASDHPIWDALGAGAPRIYTPLPESLDLSWTNLDTRPPAANDRPITSLLVAPLIARGHPLGAMTLISDASGRPYQTGDARIVQELSQNVALAIDNARLYQETRRAVEARDTVLYAVSHDLRNPLTTLGFICDHVRSTLAGWEVPVVERAAEDLDHFERLTARMQEQIDAMLDVAQMQMGRPLRLRRRPTDLVALVREIVSDYQSEKQRHRLHFTPREAELIGDWDRPRLARVVANLLANAIKYSPDGGEIEVALMREDGPGGTWARLAVRDHGLGIPSADLSRIFSWFHRGENVTGRIDGAGIGLAAAQHLVQLHGGTIAVDSTEGDGSTFTVRLPVAPLG